MFEEISKGVRDVLGLGAEDLTMPQVGLRAFIIYISAILLVKLGEKRFMGKNTAFDVIVGIMLGSILSRAVTGNASFFATLGAGAMLVGFHWLFAVASFYSDRFGTIVKGSDRVLIRDGEIQWDNMRKSHISKKDLELALRSNGKIIDPDDAKEARFERSGDISVIPRDRKEPRVVEVSVQEGVQTIRIELD